MQGTPKMVFPCTKSTWPENGGDGGECKHSDCYFSVRYLSLDGLRARRHPCKSNNVGLAIRTVLSVGRWRGRNIVFGAFVAAAVVAIVLKCIRMGIKPYQNIPTHRGQITLLFKLRQKLFQTIGRFFVFGFQDAGNLIFWSGCKKNKPIKWGANGKCTK